MHKTQPSNAERRCALTGTTAPKSTLLRLVVAPDGMLVADLKQSLPGRGVYVSVSKVDLAAAVANGTLVKAVARSLKISPKQFSIAPDLAQHVAERLKASMLSLLGLERKAGRMVLGADAVEKAGASGKITVLINASDGAGDSGKFKGRARAAELPFIDSLTREELSLALGRENVVHAALTERGAWPRFLRLAEDYERYLGHPAGHPREPVEDVDGTSAAAVV